MSGRTVAEVCGWEHREIDGDLLWCPPDGAWPALDGNGDPAIAQEDMLAWLNARGVALSIQTFVGKPRRAAPVMLSWHTTDACSDRVIEAVSINAALQAAVLAVAEREERGDET